MRIVTLFALFFTALSTPKTSEASISARQLGQQEQQQQKYREEEDRHLDHANTTIDDQRRRRSSAMEHGKIGRLQIPSSVRTNDRIMNNGGKNDDEEEEEEVWAPKYFVFHVGPPKTASTTIQWEISKVQYSFLKEDNYHYISKRNKGDRIAAAIDDVWCMKVVRRAVRFNEPMPACWEDTMVAGLKDLKGKNVLVSTESINIPEWTTNTEWWSSLAEAAMKYADLNLLVVGVYRRLYQWLPSAHYQYNKHLTGGAWPQHGGDVPQKLYPLVLESDYIDLAYGRHLWFYWIPDYSKHLPDNIQFNMLNLHLEVERSVESKFFCDMIPNAPRTCQYAKDKEKKYQGHRELEYQEKGHAASGELNYDHLARAAADAGYVDIDKYTRDHVIRAIRHYQENVLNRGGNGFPVDCPSYADLYALVYASMKWEAEIMPHMGAGVKIVQGHEHSFWAHAEEYNYCSINTTTTLQLEEWKTFFNNNFVNPTPEELPEPATVKNTSKYFVFHVGPPKTASTTIQAEISNVQDTYLVDDSYHYIGKNGEADAQLARAIHDDKCNIQLHGFGGFRLSSSLPTCWDHVMEGLSAISTAHEDKSILMSSEAINIPEWSTSHEWWTALNEAAAKQGFKLVVVAVYRRLYEWLLSVHYQYTTKNHFVGNQDWPENGGKTNPPLIPLIFESEYVVDDEDGQEGRILWYRWISTYLNEVPADVDTRILNLHAGTEHSVGTKFFCEMVPDAPETCHYSLKKERNGNSNGVSGGESNTKDKPLRGLHARSLSSSSSSSAGDAEPEHETYSFSGSLFYDLLAIAAAELRLVDTSAYSRYEVYTAIKEYQENHLKRAGNEFPLKCATDDELNRLLGASLYWERTILPEIKGSREEHVKAFWKAVQEKRFCSIDTKATVNLPEWKRFFDVIHNN